MIEKYKKAIAKLECGNTCGTAFLIDECTALTVSHCILDSLEENEEIKLTFYNIEKRDIFAVKASPIKKEQNYPVAILELEEKVETEYLKLACYKDNIERNEKVISYGYPKVKGNEGYPVDLYINDYLNKNVSEDYDISLNIDKSCRMKDYSGMSGSPVIYRNQVIGLLTEEIIEVSANCREAIDLKVISNKKVQELYDKKEIPFLSISYNELKETVRNSQKPREYQNNGHNFEERQKNYKETFVVGYAEYEEVVSDYEKAIVNELNMIFSMKNRGYCEEAWSKLLALTKEVRTSKSKPEKILAQLYYTRAIWFLDDKKDGRNAQKYLQKALDCYPDYDCRTYYAKKHLLEGNVIEVKNILLPINNVSVLNVYLQMCIYKNEIEDALEAYKIGAKYANGSTHYLMALVYILDGDYELAEDFLEKAEQNVKDIPLYIMMRGVIRYWKLLPQNMIYGDCLLPPMYANTMLLLDEEMRNEIDFIVGLYNKAYVLAEGATNVELQKQIMTVWISTLSISEVYREEGKDIAEKLLKLDSYQTQAIIYLYMTGEDLSYINAADAKKMVRKSGNRIESMIASIYLALGNNDKRSAYTQLKEFKYKFEETHMMDSWFDLVGRSCEEKEEICRLQELLENYEMEKSIKARIQGMFLETLGEYDKLLKHAETLYSETGAEIDLINLITCCERIEEWDKAEKFSEEWKDKFQNSMAKIRIIRCLAMKNKQKECLDMINNLYNSGEIECITHEVLFYEIQALKILGRYNDAIEKAQKLWDKVTNQKVLFIIAECYFLDGQEQNTIGILKDGLRKGIKAVEVYQMLAEYERHLDVNEAAKYVNKACIKSNNDPKIMMWAMQFLFAIGKSQKANELFVKLQSINQSDYFRTMTFKEVREWLDCLHQENEHKYDLYRNCQISYHLLIDSMSTSSYTLYCYRLWKYNQEQQVKKQPLLVNYGGHKANKEFLYNSFEKCAVLDFSSLVHLKHLDLLDEIQKCWKAIYVPGNIIRLIDFEQKNCTSNQPDILEERKKMMESWKKRKISYLPLISKEEAIEWEKTGIELADLVPYEVAKKNNLLCISDMFTTDLMENSNRISDKMRKEVVTTKELLNALQHRADISEELNESYNFEGKNRVREEVVEQLVEYKGKIPILVDENFLREIYEIGGISSIAQKCQVYVFENIFGSIEEEIDRANDGKASMIFLDELKDDITEGKEQGFIHFCGQHLDNKSNNYGIFANALLDLMHFSMDEKSIFVCDDRWINSYDNMGDCYFYNSADIIEFMHNKKIISDEKYTDVLSQMLCEGYSYIIPPFEYMKSLIWRTNGKTEPLQELPEELLLVSNYLVNITASESRLNDELLHQGVLPESAGFMYYMQRNLLNLLREVWCSERSNLWKQQISSWLLVNYSTFAYKSLMNLNGTKQNQDYYELELANFIFSGFFELPASSFRKGYYEWLFRWLSINGEWEKGLEERIIQHLAKLIHEAYRKDVKGLRYEIGVGALILSAIEDMPKQFREKIYKNSIIQSNIEKFEDMYILLGLKEIIPRQMFNQWLDDAMKNGLHNCIIRKDDSTHIEYRITWVIHVLFHQGFRIEYTDKNGNKNVHYYRVDQAMLLCEDELLRMKGLYALDDYVSAQNMKKYEIDINRPELRAKVAEDIVAEIKSTEKYFMHIIRTILENSNYQFFTLDEILPENPGVWRNATSNFNDLQLEKLRYNWEKRKEDIWIKTYVELYIYIYGCMNKSENYRQLGEQKNIYMAAYYADKILEQIEVCNKKETIKYSLEEISNYIHSMSEINGFIKTIDNQAGLYSQEELQKIEEEVKQFFEDDIAKKTYLEIEKVCKLLCYTNLENKLQLVSQIKDWICQQWQEEKKQEEEELLKIMEYVAMAEDNENIINHYLLLWTEVLDSIHTICISMETVRKLKSLMMVFDFEQGIKMREIVDEIVMRE